MSGSPPATSVVAKQITPTGRGAVACVALRGPREALAQLEFPFSAANRKPMAAQPLGRICFGKWGAGTVEEIVLTRVTEQYWEIHCHGGEAAVGRILTDLESLGVQPSPDSPGHWIDSRWLESHCYETALAARTARTAEIALRQAGGCLKAELQTILSLVSERSTDLTEPIRRLDLLLQWSDIGRHLVTPWTVVLAGRPNVGKSSLMNALVGYGRSIVVDRPGTTRDVVTAETAIDGWLLTLADTAGIRNASDAVEAEGIRRAEQQIRTADLVIHVQEATDFPTSELKPDQPEVPGALLVWNKCDRTIRESLPSQTDVILTSAVTGEGIQTLCKAIVGRLVPRAPGPNDVVPTGQEMIRRLEEVSRCLRDRDVAEASSRLIEMLEL